MSSPIIRNYAGKQVYKGGTVLVYGGEFSTSTRAWFGNEQAEIVDFDDGSLSIRSPSVAGEYSLYVGPALDDRSEVGIVAVVEDTSVFPMAAPLSHSVDEIAESMLGLLPRGFAWYRGKDGNFARLMRGLAFAVASIYSLACSYRGEVSPTHTVSLDEWEDDLNLPENGVVYSGTESEKTLQRRAEIIRKSCRAGGSTKNYFMSIAAVFGIPCEIYEYCKNPEQFAGVPGTDDDKRYYWMVRSTDRVPTTAWMRAGSSRAGERVRTWGNVFFKSMLNNLAPAHTKCLFAYRSNSEARLCTG